ncbi:MAG: hypothetical protein LLG08_03145 [Actinomycetia bacterium]|nr:hypothetical protein [Actinomycetes bacterium]
MSDKLTESLMEIDGETIRSLRLALGKMREALEKLRRSHDDVDGDCWYSCPKHPNYCGDQSRDMCTCGADNYNAIIDAALASTPDDGLWQEVRDLLNRASGVSDTLRDCQCADCRDWRKRRDALLGRKP